MVIKAPRALRRSVSIDVFGSMIEFEEVAPGVFGVAHDFVEDKNAVAIGKRAGLSTDGGNYAEEGEAMAARGADRGPGVGPRSGYAWTRRSSRVD